MSNIFDQSQTIINDDFLAPVRIKTLSGKRSRDSSQRKTVSFNDVPIVHELPSNKNVENSNSETFRSWTYTEMTPVSSQILPTSSSKINSNDENCQFNSSLIILPAANERTIKENCEQKKNSNCSTILSENENYKTLPFTFVPLSESTATYTSMLTTNVVCSNEHAPTSHIRVVRTRSATLPITITHSSPRYNENVSNLALRANPTINVSTTSSSSLRSTLKPKIIDFQCSQPLINSTRINSSNAHGRLIGTTNRPLASTIKYTISPSASDSISKQASFIGLPHPRSAHVANSQNNSISSSVSISDGQSLNSTIKRNPNIRQTYGSYYLHRVLLPTNIT